MMFLLPGHATTQPAIRGDLGNSRLRWRQQTTSAVPVYYEIFCKTALGVWGGRTKIHLILRLRKIQAPIPEMPSRRRVIDESLPARENPRGVPATTEIPPHLDRYRNSLPSESIMSNESPKSVEVESPPEPHQYWVVGATFDELDMFPRFLSLGYWELGWEDSQQPSMAACRNRMRAGDRIAMKQMLGRGAVTIRIKALGVIREAQSPGDARIYVNWLVRDLARDVPAHGFLAAIREPLYSNDPWVRMAFLL